MDAPVAQASKRSAGGEKSEETRARKALWICALAPLLPQIIGSAFNIWYNQSVVLPLLHGDAMRSRFFQTVIAYNLVVYPPAVWIWLCSVFSLRKALPPWSAPAELDRLRRRALNLPWISAALAGAGWLLGIPIFLVSLWMAGGAELDERLFWHLPLSFCISGFIALTHTFFMVELASHRWLLPALFRGARADQMSGVMTLPLMWRGVTWAVSAGICPLACVLLLRFAPQDGDLRWFELFVGLVATAFGLFTAVLLTGLVERPVMQLRDAAMAVADGDLSVQIAIYRPDEFGVLTGEFNRMVCELREKERLRQTFGLHVGQQAAERILARDPGLGGVLQTVTVMFVDLRSFTARSEDVMPQLVVALLNRFLTAMVEVVEDRHGGMVNKFLGDGFVALFGIGRDQDDHASRAVEAAIEMHTALAALNFELHIEGVDPIEMGVGIHTGPAVVGSIGSPRRLEFTAIGATVNLASRLEAVTKKVGCTTLISGATRSALTRPANLAPLPPVEIRGLDEPVEVFAVRPAK